MLISFSVALLACACAGFPDKPPATTVLVENRYAPASTAPIVYRARWLTAFFQDPIAPGASSAPQDTVPASENVAYAVLAAGWDPASAARPTSFVVLQSRDGFAIGLDGILRIPVDDSTFEGNCAAGSRLTQDTADFLTQVVFADDFAGLHYDASTCTTTQIGDGGAP